MKDVLGDKYRILTRKSKIRPDRRGWQTRGPEKSILRPILGLEPPSYGVPTRAIRPRREKR